LVARAQHGEHFVAGLDRGFGLRHEARAVAQDRYDETAFGQRQVADLGTGSRGAFSDFELDDLELLLPKVEQVHEPVMRDLVLELFLDREIAFPVRLDHGYLMPLAEQLAGKIPANLSGSGDDDVHQCSVSGVTRWSTQSGCSVL